MSYWSDEEQHRRRRQVDFSFTLLQKFFIFSKVGIYTVSKRLMKSHWRFLRPGECQCLHGFSIAETNTPGSPPLCCIQLSARCVLLSIFDRNMHWCHETEWSSSCFTRNSTQKGFRWRIYPSPYSLWGAATTSVPITPMTAIRIFSATGDNKELIFINIPPWVTVHSS